MHKFFWLTICLLLSVTACGYAAEPITLNLWPGKPPGETKELPPEADTQKPTDKLIAGKTVAKIGNVSTPTLAVYKPDKAKDTGAAVIICPGGGHRILALDLEGTEVAAWLNSIGVTGIVLKYRVPARDENKRWLAAVQDAQRAVSTVRSKASEWGLDAKRIGVLGFSAGGETAGLAALFSERQYAAIDAIDKVSARPDFAVLVYPGGLLARNEPELQEHVRATKDAPPFFFAHAYDDGVSVLNSVLLFAELKKAGVAAELHAYASGGHGFGLRPESNKPNTYWPERCHEWMKASGFLKPQS